MERQPITTQTLAESALNLYSQIAPLDAQLETIKQQLREVAEGERLVVPGKGIVLIKRGSPGKSKDTLVVDETLFGTLDVKLQTMLQLKGVIRTERKVTSPRNAPVEIKPNV